MFLLDVTGRLHARRRRAYPSAPLRFNTARPSKLGRDPGRVTARLNFPREYRLSFEDGVKESGPERSEPPGPKNMALHQAATSAA
ncbi:MAG: hypothetical protein KJ057_12410 [Phycisphaerae bacterium]|nr:MAG: hypothetical protein EDS66_12130 [Planctomycetota bacterium]KAB2950100.1 MAG: hypothetical protein F9K17_00575 [Phycisphaerae bacterium]MBE7456433.1 hypothetical protein [Planctomycetia bacterium]MCK6465358.1 hypothetical protein [Phycisphaerae bacterium]MCL4719267.1 hypothetical protein [Phycisphaerae bacterium]